MEAISSLPQLLARRKVTRAVSEVIRKQMRDCMAVLAPLFRPRHIFGDFIQGGTREIAKGPEKALQELQAIFAVLAAARPFSLEQKELMPPLTFESSVLEFAEFEYSRQIAGKTVRITSPLRWTVSYANYPLKRLRELSMDKNRTNTEMRQFLLHYTGLHVVVSRQPALQELLKALHLRVATEKFPEFADLPITCLSSDVRTIIPPDDVIVESTEISGRDVFEEVVDVTSIQELADPLKDKLTELTASAEA
jgi:hypothetical protein